MFFAMSQYFSYCFLDYSQSFENLKIRHFFRIAEISKKISLQNPGIVLRFLVFETSMRNGETFF